MEVYDKMSSISPCEMCVQMLQLEAITAVIISVRQITPVFANTVACEHAQI